MPQRRRTRLMTGGTALLMACGLVMTGCTGQSSGTAGGADPEGDGSMSPVSDGSGAAGGDEPTSSGGDSAAPVSPTVVPPEPVPTVQGEPSQGALAFARFDGDAVAVTALEAGQPGTAYAVHGACDGTGSVSYTVRRADESSTEELLSGDFSCPAEFYNSLLEIPEDLESGDPGTLFQIVFDGPTPQSGTAMLEIIPDPATGPGSTAPSVSTSSEATTMPQIPTEPAEDAVAYATLNDGNEYVGLVEKVTPGQDYSMHVVCDQGEVEYRLVAPEEGTEPSASEAVAEGRVPCPADVTVFEFTAPRMDPGITLPNDGALQVSITGADDGTNALLELIPGPADS